MALCGFLIISFVIFCFGWFCGMMWAGDDLAKRAETGQIWHYKDHTYRIVDWWNVFPSQQRKEKPNEFHS